MQRCYGVRCTETEADAEDVAVPDAGSVVSHQSLAYAVVVSPRGLPPRAERTPRLAGHRHQGRIRPPLPVAQVKGRGPAAARHAQQVTRVSHCMLAFLATCSEHNTVQSLK